jgi:replication factor A1
MLCADRFFLKLHVEDETKSTTFVMFDKDAFTLLNKTCAELVKSVKKVKPNFVTLSFY